MKFVPRRSQAVGRMVVKRTQSVIVRPNETKQTKFVLLDIVGPGAAAEGLKVGDIVMPGKIHGIEMDGGTIYRPLVNEEDVLLTIQDADLTEFVVQVDSGGKYVEFNDPDAAKPFSGLAAPSNGSTGHEVTGVPA